MRYCKFCGEELKLKGKQTCNEKCRHQQQLKRRAERRKLAKEKDLCILCCYQPKQIGLRCNSCEASYRRAEKKYRPKRLARKVVQSKFAVIAGLCRQCKREPLYTKAYCLKCRTTRNHSQNEIKKRRAVTGGYTIPKHYPPGKLWCSGCKGYFDKLQFGVCKGNRTGFSNRCNSCNRASSLKTYYKKKGIEDVNDRSEAVQNRT